MGMAEAAGKAAAKMIDKASAAAITAQAMTASTNIERESAVKQAESIATTATNNAKTSANTLDAASSRS